jgi:hypothetical protein
MESRGGSRRRLFTINRLIDIAAGETRQPRLVLRQKAEKKEVKGCFHAILMALAAII